MSIEAMKQSLEALELALTSHDAMLLSDPPLDAWKTRGVNREIVKATTALRQAIAEAEKQDLCKDGSCDCCWTHLDEQPKREWVGLTDEERYECLRGTDWQYDPEQYARNIEAKLKEKNQ